MAQTVIQKTQELILQAQEGDHAALDRLYELYAERVQWMVRLRLGSEFRAKLDSMDVVQDAMINAFKGLGQFTYKHEGDFLRWLSKVAENAFLNHVNRLHADKRDLRREVPLEQSESAQRSKSFRASEPFETTTPSRIIANHEDLARLERALDTLNPEYREVITLAKLEGLSYQVIGDKLNKSPDAIRMLAVRAMAALTAEFGKAS